MPGRSPPGTSRRGAVRGGFRMRRLPHGRRGQEEREGCAECGLVERGPQTGPGTASDGPPRCRGQPRRGRRRDGGRAGRYRPPGAWGPRPPAPCRAGRLGGRHRIRERGRSRAVGHADPCRRRGRGGSAVTGGTAPVATAFRRGNVRACVAATRREARAGAGAAPVASAPSGPARVPPCGRDGTGVAAEVRVVSLGRGSAGSGRKLPWGSDGGEAAAGARAAVVEGAAGKGKAAG